MTGGPVESLETVEEAMAELHRATIDLADRHACLGTHLTVLADAEYERMDSLLREGSVPLSIDRKIARIRAGTRTIRASLQMAEARRQSISERLEELFASG